MGAEALTGIIVAPSSESKISSSLPQWARAHNVEVEEKMTGLAAEKLPLTRFELTREEAVKLLTEKASILKFLTEQGML